MLVIVRDSSQRRLSAMVGADGQLRSWWTDANVLRGVLSEDGDSLLPRGHARDRAR